MDSVLRFAGMLVLVFVVITVVLRVRALLIMRKFIVEKWLPNPITGRQIAWVRLPSLASDRFRSRYQETVTELIGEQQAEITSTLSIDDDHRGGMCPGKRALFYRRLREASRFEWAARQYGFSTKVPVGV